MSFEQTEWVWMNGQIVRWKDATTHVSAHALHYGSGVFEGLRCYDTINGPAVFRMEDHLDRLHPSAARYEIPVAEGSGENLFLVKKEKLYTNSEHDFILKGITRDSVIQIASDLGVGIEITPLSLDDLLNCDEAFFSGTAAEIVPIRELDGKKIGAGKRGAVTAQIQQTFFAATSGGDDRYQYWLHPVEKLKDANL